MAKYGIPRQVVNGFDIISSLQDSDIDLLFSLLQNAKVGDGIKTLSEKLALESSLGEYPSLEIIAALFSMITIYAESKNSSDKFLDDFINSYKESYKKDEPQLELLRNNISKLIPSFNSIRQTLKARNLIIENANNFVSARIVSDIRIVYDDEAEMEKKEQIAVVVHNLRMVYSDGLAEDKIFHISLDLSDLGELKESINRALEKDNLIRTKHHELSFVNVK